MEKVRKISICYKRSPLAIAANELKLDTNVYISKLYLSDKFQLPKGFREWVVLEGICAPVS